jgi:hypothetical protein
VDTQTNTAVEEQSQGDLSPVGSGRADLAPRDRHLLFRSTLGLFLRRANRHVPVTASDLIRLLPYVDPDPDDQGRAA